jgi:hypothetical protein
MAAPDVPIKELQEAGIIETAKNGISEFADHTPEQTWQRLRELRPIVGWLFTEKSTTNEAIARLEAKIDDRLAAKRDTGGPLGLLTGVFVRDDPISAASSSTTVFPWRTNPKRYRWAAHRQAIRTGPIILACSRNSAGQTLQCGLQLSRNVYPQCGRHWRHFRASVSRAKSPQSDLPLDSRTGYSRVVVG